MYRFLTQTTDRLLVRCRLLDHSCRLEQSRTPSLSVTFVASLHRRHVLQLILEALKALIIIKMPSVDPGERPWAARTSEGAQFY